MTTNESDRERRTRAYQAGARISKDRMGREAPLDAEALAAVEASDVVVVPRRLRPRRPGARGARDAVHAGRSRTSLGAVDLRPEQLLVVNCPGDQLGQRDVLRIRDFVTAGGSLFTTDWALRHVLEPAFPDIVAYNEHPTADDVVRVEVRDAREPVPARRDRPGRGPAVVARGLVRTRSGCSIPSGRGAPREHRAAGQVRRGAGRGPVPPRAGRGVPHDLALLPAADRAPRGAPPSSSPSSTRAAKGVALDREPRHGRPLRGRGRVGRRAPAGCSPTGSRDKKRRVDGAAARQREVNDMTHPIETVRTLVGQALTRRAHDRARLTLVPRRLAESPHAARTRSRPRRSPTGTLVVEEIGGGQVPQLGSTTRATCRCCSSRASTWRARCRTGS